LPWLFFLLFIFSLSLSPSLYSALSVGVRLVDLLGPRSLSL